LLRGLEVQDVGDVLGRDGVMVRFKLNEAIWVADPKSYLRTIIGMKGQGLKPLLGKELQGRVPSGVVDMEISFLLEPPPGRSPKIFQILKVSSIEEIPFYVFEGSFNFPLGAVRQLHNVTNLRSNFFG
jgi:hypothetical protein